jgi:thioredoxin 1
MKSVRLALLLTLSALALPLGAHAAAPGPATPVPAHGQGAKGALPRLVFFMNPNGMPCQLQDRVLQDMGAELSERAQLVYYKTTQPSDIARFQEFGIRALPTLVVTDANGRELRRGTPGILQMPQILKLLQP